MFSASPVYRYCRFISSEYTALSSDESCSVKPMMDEWEARARREGLAAFVPSSGATLDEGKNMV